MVEMTPRSTQNTKRRPRHPDSAVAWFVMLEYARKHGDRRLEAKATKRLEKLGVVVRYQEVLA